MLSILPSLSRKRELKNCDVNGHEGQRKSEVIIIIIIIIFRVLSTEKVWEPLL